MPPTPIVAVVGATASGKSDLALDLAEALGGEIVNTDAMAVYRGMDVGTAKLPVAERRGIPHHLLDLLDVSESLTVALFQQWARAAIADLRAREQVPVLVGGSALYTRAVLDRFEFPGTDEAVRRRLEADLSTWGPEVMHQRLAESTRSPRATSGPTTAAASCARWRSWRSPDARSPRRFRDSSTPTRTPSRSASTSTGPPSSSGSRGGWRRCSRRASSRRSNGCWRPGFARGGRPAWRSATAR